MSYFDSPFPTDFYLCCQDSCLCLGFVLVFIEMPSNLRHESVKLEQSQGFIYAHGLMMFIFAYIYNPILPVYFNAKAPWVVVNAIMLGCSGELIRLRCFQR